ncbi:hypothetical protein J3F84DRAFT_269883 [Trichoderma pleuroticola]
MDLYFNLPPARWLGLAFSPPNVPIEILRIFTCLVSGVMPHVSRCTSMNNCSRNRQPLPLHASSSHMGARKLLRDDATAKQQKTDRHKFPNGTIDSKLSLPDSVGGILLPRLALWPPVRPRTFHLTMYEHSIVSI